MLLRQALFFIPVQQKSGPQKPQKLIAFQGIQKLSMMQSSSTVETLQHFVC